MPRICETCGAARLDLVSGTGAGSGARTIFRIRDGKAETVGVTLSPEVEERERAEVAA